ncbi:MAG: cell division protein ZapA [Myxococcota bacterium]
MGREIRIKSDEDPERLRELAAYVDELIGSVAPGKTLVPDQQILLVAALRMADEVFRLRDEKRELSTVLKRSTRALLGRISTQ